MTIFGPVLLVLGGMAIANMPSVVAAIQTTSSESAKKSSLLKMSIILVIMRYITLLCVKMFFGAQKQISMERTGK